CGIRMRPPKSPAGVGPGAYIAGAARVHNKGVRLDGGGDEMKLAGKSAVVTGAGSGIGEAIAKRFAEAGLRVVAADVSESGARRVAWEIEAAGGAALAVAADVSQEDDVGRMMEAAVEAFGSLDVLVNNA